VTSASYDLTSLTGSLGSYLFKIDKTKNTTSPTSILLAARTKGLVMQHLTLTWEVCLTTSLTLTSNARTIGYVFDKYAADEGRTNSKLIPFSLYKSMFSVKNCEQCTLKSYRLVINDTLPFTGPEMSLDNDFNLVISTYLPFRAMPIYI